MAAAAAAAYKNAMQAVFGEGTRNAAVMLAGEQPGDQEDTRDGPSYARPGSS